MRLAIAARVPVTAVEGPGRRFALWVQGCTLRCPGCCNPHMFAPGGGTSIAVAALVEQIEAARREHAIEGITVLGGEPLQQLPAVALLCESIYARGLGVIVFTGHRLAEARVMSGFARLWRNVDTLVTGRYDRTRPEPDDGRRFIGSTNQRLHHRTHRYRDAAAWTGPRDAEIHVDPDGTVHVLGSPQTIAPLLTALRSAPTRP